jgi:hypothetical protein
VLAKIAKLLNENAHLFFDSATPPDSDDAAARANRRAV